MAVQTTVSFYNGQVLPGTLGSGSDQAVIDTVVAGEVISAGTLVEIDSNGLAIVPKSASLGKLGGLALRQVGRMGGAFAPGGSSDYQIGEEVPVLRSGRAYAKFNGGTASLYGTLNVKHSTTIATNRGWLTASAASATTGAEIDAMPAGATAVSATPTGDATVVLVSMFLP